MNGTALEERLARRLSAYPPLWRIAHGLDARRMTVRGWARIGSRRRVIESYLAEHEVRLLRLGSKHHTDRAWLSADLVPPNSDVVYLDARRPLPFPDRSFDALSCEHLIEHLPYRSAVGLVGECHRILRPGGVARFATPDLERMCRLVVDPHDDRSGLDYLRWQNAIRWSNDPDVPGPEAVPPGTAEQAAFVLNRVVREWGHTFCYNEALLRHLFVLAGFCNVERRRPQESASPLLMGSDRHGEEVGEEQNAFESLIVEGAVAHGAPGSSASVARP